MLDVVADSGDAAALDGGPERALVAAVLEPRSLGWLYALVVAAALVAGFGVGYFFGFKAAEHKADRERVSSSLPGWRVEESGQG